MMHGGTAEPARAWVEGGARWRLQLSLMVNFFLLMALYSGVLGVLLPNQIAELSPDSKENNLALLFAITSIFSTLATPIAGALSDRTRTRWGRRSPWIAVGSLVGSACLFGVSWMTGFWSLVVLWVMAAIAYNSMQPAMTTLVADRFAPETRGGVSGIVGAGMTAGLTAGTVVAGYLASERVLAYGLFAGAIAASCIAFVAINREPPSDALPRRTMHWGAFFKSFWISPREHPDFAWAFASRFTIYMGYQAVAAYLLYILRDYIGLADGASNVAIANMALITLVCLVVSSLASGWLSDRLQRRKPFVIGGSLIMGAAMAAPLIAPSMAGMWVYAGVIGIGYGMFMSIDMALMTQVLPQAALGDEGKDLGVLTTAVNIPQIISPVMAAVLLTVFSGDYRAIFITALFFVFASALCVLPIKSVR
ncbi:MFS transporter [Novosphingobium sp. P6W]|uniref:MFS transporter n=1 Tax=Novosphingobium sp. P6W TaxID=1609758 RepID=UPI0005C2BB43|nr:MFS transporter [Novosphingobium sp. P6W]AXB78714.1 MFS transporter [Novosphingobium sp. P6W]KIS31734.1 MFS transporter [Novosphingobium sp. P6W]